LRRERPPRASPWSPAQPRRHTRRSAASGQTTGRGTKQYHRVDFDLSAHLGERIYVEIVDRATGGRGHIKAVDVNVPARRPLPALSTGTNHAPTPGVLRNDQAVEHSIITAIWHMLSDHVPYQELGGTYFTRRDPERATRRDGRRIMSPLRILAALADQRSFMTFSQVRQGKPDQCCSTFARLFLSLRPERVPDGPTQRTRSRSRQIGAAF
jgi:hypothetical protein